MDSATMEAMPYEDDHISSLWQSISPDSQQTPGVIAGELVEKGGSDTDIHEANAAEVSGSRACESCRRKKRKCTFEKPACYLCCRSNTECVYASRKRKPGPELGSKRLRNLDLLSRITMLESMLKGSLPGLSNLSDNSFVPFSVQSRPDAEAPGNREPLLPSPDERFENVTGMHVIPTVINSQSVTLAQASLAHLFEVYFDHIQPAFPLFRCQNFFNDYSQGLLTLDLLAVMLALAARFSAQAPLFRYLDLDGWKALLNRSQTRRFPANSDAIDLNTVKKECLLVVFEYTQSPGLKAWRQAGVMTRTAIGHGLHKVDDLRSCGLIADDELEEYRFVWWTIWKLDVCFNGIALM